jgi:hypothetical protein
MASLLALASLDLVGVIFHSFCTVLAKLVNDIF